MALNALEHDVASFKKFEIHHVLNKEYSMALYWQDVVKDDENMTLWHYSHNISDNMILYKKYD